MEIRASNENIDLLMINCFILNSTKKAEKKITSIET